MQGRSNEEGEIVTADEPAAEADRDWTAEAEELVSTRPFRRGQVIRTGVVLGVFDAVDGTPRPAADIAGALDLHPDRAYRLLRALAAIGVLREDDRRFAITRLGAPFTSSHPRSLVDPVRLGHGPELVAAMGHLPAVVRGETPDGFVREFGRGFYEHADRTPAFADAFHGAMARPSSDGEPTVEAFEPADLASVGHVCDVGGGEGRFLCALLAAYPALEGTVYDLPTPVEAREPGWPAAMGVADRCAYVAGDMFEGVPEADAYVFKGVFCNWTADECERVLSNVLEAAGADARLFVVQRVLSAAEPTERNAIGDLSQLVYFGGRHRTEAEWRALFERAGWALADVRPIEDKVSSLLVAERR